MGNLEKHLHSFPARTVASGINEMNIQHAIKSGKSFRRRNWPEDWYIRENVEVVPHDKHMRSSKYMSFKEVR